MSDTPYEEELLSTFDYENTLATAGLEPTRDGEGVQPLGLRDKLNDLAEDTGRIWTPDRFTTTSFGTFVEQYSTEGATLYLDEGEWFMTTKHGSIVATDRIGPDHDNDYDILDQATKDLMRWEQHLDQRQKGQGHGY